MENLEVLPKEGNQLNGEKPPPRVCPRCKSDNTKFCYNNNRSVSQPRYFCKSCRRHWTHGGTLRNIPIGGSCRKPKPLKKGQSSFSQMVSVEIKQASHQPFKHVQENDEFAGSFRGSSPPSTIVENHFNALHEFQSIRNVSPIRSFQPMENLDFPGESFQHNYYDVGSNDLIGNLFISQSTGGYVDNHNDYHINQVETHSWHQSFNDTMNMNQKASTSGSRGCAGCAGCASR